MCPADRQQIADAVTQTQTRCLTIRVAYNLQLASQNNKRRVSHNLLGGGNNNKDDDDDDTGGDVSKVNITLLSINQTTLRCPSVDADASA